MKRGGSEKINPLRTLRLRVLCVSFRVFEEAVLEITLKSRANR